jgi:quercetin dioxygenase-like cupin family protein
VVCYYSAVEFSAQITNGATTTMLNIRKTVLTGLAVVAIGAVWHSRSIAQENSSIGVVTVFDHEKMDASFAKAVSNGGASLLWSHTSSKGTYSVDTHSRESVKAACKTEGCSHAGYTAVVYVVSGAATLVVGGTAKTRTPDKFGGQSIQGGESHRIGKGDVFIMPPDTIHWYKNVETPFRYLEVPVP